MTRFELLLAAALLVTTVAVRTFLNGGKVFAVPRQEVPDGQAMAAVFRY